LPRHICEYAQFSNLATGHESLSAEIPSGQAMKILELPSDRLCDLREEATTWIPLAAKPFTNQTIVVENGI